MLGVLLSISVAVAWPQGAMQPMKHVADWAGVTVYESTTHGAGLPHLVTLIEARDSSRAFDTQSILDTFTACIVRPALGG